MKVLTSFAVLSLCLCSAYAAEMTKQQCLTCHGPFEALIAKGIRVEADPKPVNPHQFIPHTSKGAMDQIWECTMCHTSHSMPPKKDPHRDKANVEACYQCHHQYNFKNCNSCHGTANEKQE